jgi:hypothetical protein
VFVFGIIEANPTSESYRNFRNQENGTVVRFFDQGWKKRNGLWYKSEVEGYAPTVQVKPNLVILIPDLGSGMSYAKGIISKLDRYFEIRLITFTAVRRIMDDGSLNPDPAISRSLEAVANIAMTRYPGSIFTIGCNTISLYWKRDLAEMVKNMRIALDEVVRIKSNKKTILLGTIGLSSSVTKEYLPTFLNQSIQEKEVVS